MRARAKRSHTATEQPNELHNRPSGQLPDCHIMNNHTKITFIKEDPWRIFRIMAEFVDSFETLSQVGPGVTVFGSARMAPSDPYYQGAVTLAKGLAKHKLAIITGGGPGIMEAANKGAAAARGKSVG